MKPVFGCLIVLLLAAGCTARAEDPGYTVLLETQPSPMQSGRLNTVTVRVKDRADRPVTGAKVTVKAEHKGMAHGGGTFSTDEREPGVYSGGLIPPMADTASSSTSRTRWARSRRALTSTCGEALNRPETMPRSRAMSAEIGRTCAAPGRQEQAPFTRKAVRDKRD